MRQIDRKLTKFIRCRRTGKVFYGFVPLYGLRLVVVRWSMYLLSFCQLLGKSMEMAILNQVGGKTLAVGVLGGEMVAYLVYKLVRRDFRYWLPMPRGNSLARSLIVRLTVKVICDFTGFLHARHERDGRILLVDEHGVNTSSTKDTYHSQTQTQT